MTRRTGKSRVTPKKVYSTDPTKKPDGAWVFCENHGRWEHLKHDHLDNEQGAPQINEERPVEAVVVDEVIELGDELLIAENPIDPEQLAEQGQPE